MKGLFKKNDFDLQICCKRYLKSLGPKMLKQCLKTGLASRLHNQLWSNPFLGKWAKISIFLASTTPAVVTFPSSIFKDGFWKADFLSGRRIYGHIISRQYAPGRPMGIHGQTTLSLQTYRGHAFHHSPGQQRAPTLHAGRGQNAGRFLCAHTLAQVSYSFLNLKNRSPESLNIEKMF